MCGRSERGDCRYIESDFISTRTNIDCTLNVGGENELDYV